jgi:hypothetical protein
MDVSQIINKYHVGKLKGDTLFLDPCETIYLYIKGKIIPETKMDMLQVIGSIFDEDLYIYYIYSILKERVNCKAEGNKFYYRKLGEEFGMPVILIKEGELTNFSSLYENLPAIFITIDEEQSITYFRANAIDPQGHADSSISAEKIGKLNNMSYVINSEPEWFGQEVMGVKILNEYESNYILGELKRMKINFTVIL